jgi:hypothetical protein
VGYTIYESFTKCKRLKLGSGQASDLEIVGSDYGDCDDCCLLGCYDVQFVRLISTFIP